jgi:hypothetical protein
MALKIPVKDRVATYPGRVLLTPVSGAENTYDMTRADSPIEGGTPINKELFDNKTYTLTEDVTVYVSPSGSDTDGDGSADAPFKTIQKAVDEIPKYLGGFTATIDIASGTYEERVEIFGFSGGTLAVGVTGRTVTVRGFNIVQSSTVELKISNVTRAEGFSGALVYVGKDSNVVQGSILTINCVSGPDSGLGVAYGATYIANGTTTAVNNCTTVAIRATLGSRVVLHTVQGGNNRDFGIVAEQGGLLTYNTSALVATNGNVARTGGRILAGSAVAPSSIE